MSLVTAVMSKYPELAKGEEKAKGKKPEVEVHAYVMPPTEAKYLREEEKQLMIQRKQLKLILDEWDPMKVSTKARKDFERQLRDLSGRLKDLRAKMGK